MTIASSTFMDFNELPKEIGLKIFSFLPLDERLRASKVSNLFRELAYDPVTFRNNYKEYNDDESSIKEIQDILRDARSFEIDITQVTFENIKKVKTEVEQIKKESIIKIWERIKRDYPDLLDYPDFIQFKDKTYSEIIDKFDVWTNKNKYNIPRLNLTFLDLKYLPDSIGNLTNLKWLHLDNNKIRSLPNAIGKLIILEKLALHNNQISSLPNSIGKLTNLKWLQLYNNPISSLPDSIVNLTNLEELVLHDNQISSLPDLIGNLSNLKVLYHKISTLSESFLDNYFAHNKSLI